MDIFSCAKHGAISTHMNTLFENNMDMVQPHMFHPLNTPKDGTYLEMPTVVDWEPLEWEHDIRPYMIKLEDGTVEYLKAGTFEWEKDGARLRILRYESQRDLDENESFPFFYYNMRREFIDYMSRVKESLIRLVSEKATYELPDALIEDMVDAMIDGLIEYRRNWDNDMF